MKNNLYNRIFNRSLLNEITRLQKEGYEFLIEFCDKDVLKMIPDEKSRDLYYFYVSTIDKKFISLFKSIYELDNNLANLLLNNNVYLEKEEDYEFLINNVNEIKHILINSKYKNTISLLKEQVVAIKNYGKDVINYTNEDYNLIKCFTNKDIKNANLNLETIKHNKDIIESIIIGNDNIKKEILLNMLCLNSKELFENYEDIKEWDYSILNFYIFSNFDKDISKYFETIKENRTIRWDYLYNYLFNYPQIVEKILDYCKKNNDFPKYKTTIIYKYTGEKYISGSFEELNDDYVKSVVKMIDEIEEKSSIKDVDDVISKYKLEANIYKFRKCFRKALVKELNDATFTLPEDFKIVDGIKIVDNDIIDLSEFSIVTHSITSSRKEHGSPNGDLAVKLINHPELWKDPQVKGSTILSCKNIHDYFSTSGYGISKNSINHQSGNIVLGFSNVENFIPYKVSGGDGITDMSGKAKITQMGGNITSRPVSFFNNFLNRSDQNETAFYRINENGAKILPDFIIAFENYNNTRTNGITEPMKLWAKYYDIPIVIIDGNKVYNNANSKLKNDEEMLKKGLLSLELFEDMLHRYRTIEDVRIVHLNFVDILDKFLEECNKNISIQNIEVIKQIIDKYSSNFDAFFDIDSFELKNGNISSNIDFEEYKKLKKVDIANKIDYLNKIYVELTTSEMLNNKMTK